MNLREFSKKNRERCEAVDGFNHRLDSWSLSDWLVAMGGEVGEAMNIVKKLNRIRDGIPGNDQSEDELRFKLACELADVFIYLDLTFQALGIDSEQMIKVVFNSKSIKIGCPIRIEHDEG